MNASRVEDWLASEYWPVWRSDDVWHDWDGEGHLYWVIPDYAEGRSRVLGMEGHLLEETTLSQVEVLLSARDWKGRIEQAPLLIQRDAIGSLDVTTWEIVLPEVWFPDPRGGFFRAFVSDPPSRMSGTPPTRGRALVLHGATWSSIGPSDPAPLSTYSVDSLTGYIPSQKAV